MRFGKLQGKVCCGMIALATTGVLVFFIVATKGPCFDPTDAQAASCSWSCQRLDNRCAWCSGNSVYSPVCAQRYTTRLMIGGGSPLNCSSHTECSTCLGINDGSTCPGVATTQAGWSRTALISFLGTLLFLSVAFTFAFLYLFVEELSKNNKDSSQGSPSPGSSSRPVTGKLAGQESEDPAEPLLEDNKRSGSDSDEQRRDLEDPPSMVSTRSRDRNTISKASKTGFAANSSRWTQDPEQYVQSKFSQWGYS